MARIVFSLTSAQVRALHASYPGSHPHAHTRNTRGVIDPFKKEIGNAIVLSSGPKKQNTRLLKVQCPGCGYTMRITQKWIDQGTPTCVCGEETQVQKI